MTTQFEKQFEILTGKSPLAWQVRLYRDWFSKGNFPEVIDLPTGLGKTMVMAIWLISRCHGVRVPTRLIYVVDRRTVVDQATDLASHFAYLLSPMDETDAQRRYKPRAEVIDRKRVAAESLQELRRKLTPDDSGLAISTLRGQLADNREWTRDISKPAIIIGTVDLIGSALLFSGYRTGFKSKPLHAGLLGQDSLLVLDEAHLSKPFDKLITSITDFQKNDRLGASSLSHSVEPLKVIRMSATTSGREGEIFNIKNSDLVPELLNREGNKVPNPIVERFEAKKSLSLAPPVEANKLNAAIADAATKLAEDPKVSGKRIVAFVRKPDDALAIAELIRKREFKVEDTSGNKPKTVKTCPYSESVNPGAVRVLTGTMRGLERDELVVESVFKDRWLNGELEPSAAANRQPVFLISTSAGEVGFDLNADHMVCDATTIDSLIQRLGRVNRRGMGDASIQLFVEAPKKDDTKQKKVEGIALSIDNTIELLRESNELLRGCTDGTNSLDVSPKNIAALKASDHWKQIPDSQTKSRYELACSPDPTTAELTDILLDAWSMTSIRDRMPGRPDVAPWLRGIEEDQAQTTIAWRAELDLPGFNQLDINEIEEWFDAHRILSHETLSVPTHVAARWFTARWQKLSSEQQSNIGSRSVAVDRAGLKLISIRDLYDQLARKSGDTIAPIRNADLTIPASFGGIERDRGMLDDKAPESSMDEDKRPAPEQNGGQPQFAVAADVADVRGRYREISTKSEGGETERKALGGGTKPNNPSQFTLTLESDDNRTVKLRSHVPRREKLDAGQRPQSLEGHVTDVRKRAEAIIESLNLKSNDPIRLALELAANWHDHGKNRDFFQRTVGGQKSDGQRPWPEQVRGKSGGRDFGRAPRGYRHEFGSLREFVEAFKAGNLLDHFGEPVSSDVFDLAMHLIATHHGQGRPHFAKGGFDPDAEGCSDEIHTEVIRRFARLQRKYGWWHLAWLENLLRCADAMASADPETGVDEIDDSGGGDQ